MDDEKGNWMMRNYDDFLKQGICSVTGSSTELIEFHYNFFIVLPGQTKILLPGSHGSIQ